MLFLESVSIDILDSGKGRWKRWANEERQKEPVKETNKNPAFLAGTCRHQPNAGLVDFTFGAYNHSFWFRFACLPDRCAIPIYHGYHQTLCTCKCLLLILPSYSVR